VQVGVTKITFNKGA